MVRSQQDARGPSILSLAWEEPFTSTFADSSPFLHSMPKDLSETLKEATKEVHTRAENVEFMRNFQKGQVTREGFKVCDCRLARTFVCVCVEGWLGGTPRDLRPVIEWRDWSQGR